MNQNGKARSVGEQVLTGTLWMGGWRWTARLLGFVSTIVIARLLVPEDFGIAATALLVVSFFDILIDLGTDKYLIRLSEPTRDDYDTAWTLRLLVIGAAAVLIFFAADTAADLFGDERLALVLKVLAMASLMRGFVNIGLMMYRRNMQFGRIAMLGLGQRLVAFTTTITLAFLLRSYWALIFGEIAFRAAELVFSYVFHSYRPRFRLVEFRKQWLFCKWIVAKNIASFLQGRGDQLVVAKFFGVETMGLYAMAIRFAELPTKHLLAPILQPVYSGLAKKQENPAELRRSVLHVMGATSVVVFPAATLVAALSSELVGALLGSNWLPSEPLVGPILFTLVAALLAESAVTTLTLIGRVRLLATLQWVSAAAVVLLMLAVVQSGDIELLVTARMLLGVVLLVVSLQAMRLALALSWSPLFEAIYRPGVASLVMAWIIDATVAQFHGVWQAILVGTVSGVLSYLVALYGLWRIRGSPYSAEAMLVKKLLALVVRRVSGS